MKELSVEQKAKAYDEAFEEAKNIHRFSSNIAEIKLMEEIFPELAESEDEKIRKWIIAQLEIMSGSNDIDRENMILKAITWLEKQGEQKYKFRIGDTIKEKSTGDVVTICEVDLKNREYRLSNTGFIPFKYEYLWELVEQPADKVEPKFKVGDWIVNDYCIGKVIELTDDAYLLNTRQGIPFSCEHNTHLWSIQDAKDGDVLSDETTIFIFKDLLSDGSVMSYCDYDTDSGESDAFCPLSVNLICSKITPATKEQRDLLFQKMKEARYEWDAKKKHLKQL